MKRKEIIEKAQKVVIKVGSSVLTTPKMAIDLSRIRHLTEEISYLMASGRKVALVSSGAIAVGLERLDLRKGVEGIPDKQAVAAVGQPHLMALYDTYFQKKRIQISQILLTRDDMNHRRRYLNARDTLAALFRLGALPIINENDTVVVEEIKVGDNDNLSVLVSSLIQADLLIILSDTEGLFDKDPKIYPEACLISEVGEIDEQIMCTAGESFSPTGIGGMAVKLDAIRKAASFGIPTILASGKREHVLRDIFSGDPVGTLFLPRHDSLSCKKQWIAYGVRSAGSLFLDEGAVEALLFRGKSLLPTGVVRVEGTFERGEGVDVRDRTGELVAKGLVNYSAQEVAKIRGQNSQAIQRILGYTWGDELIHRDHLVILFPTGKET